RRREVDHRRSRCTGRGTVVLRVAEREDVAVGGREVVAASGCPRNGGDGDDRGLEVGGVEVSAERSSAKGAHVAVVGDLPVAGERFGRGGGVDDGGGVGGCLEVGAVRRPEAGGGAVVVRDEVSAAAVVGVGDHGLV